MKKALKWMLVLITVLAVIAMAGCGKQEEADETTTEAVSKVDAIKAAGKITMLTNAAFAPYEYLGEDGQVTGVDVAIAQAIADELEVELEVVDMDFDGIVLAVQTGKGDLGIAGMTATEERAKSVDFSVNYVDTGIYIIVPEGSEIATADDLVGKTIGVQLGTTSDLYVTGMEDEGNATCARYKTFPDAVAELTNGKIEAVVCDELPAKEAVANTSGIVLIDEPLTVEQYAIAIAQENDDLTEVVNSVLNRMLEDGTIAELIATHMEASKALAE